MILRELAARYDLKFNEKAFKKADKSIEGAASKLKQLGGLLVGGVVARGFVKFIDGIRDVGDEIDKTSIALGVSRQALQEWRFAAGLGGVKTQELNVAMRTLQKAALDASEGAAEYKDEFDRMGIVVTDTNGKLKSADMLLMEMSDGLQTLETDTEKVATASNLLGRSGARLLPLFKDGSKGIAEMRKEARELGGILGDDLVDASVDLTDDIWRLDFAMRGIKARIGRIIIPIYIKLVQWSTKLSKKFQDFTKDTDIVANGLKVLGAVAAAAAVKMLIPFIPALLVFAKFAVIIAAVILLVDELNTLFKGGKTVIGKYIDEAYGLGTAHELVENHREGVRLLKEAWEDTKTALNNYGADAKRVGSQMVEDWTWAINEIINAFDRLFEPLEKLEGVLPGVGKRIRNVFGLGFKAAEVAPGLGPVVQAVKNRERLGALLPGTGEEAGKELRRRQKQRARGRGLGAGTFRAPEMGETLKVGAQVPRAAPIPPAPTVPVIARRRVPAGGSGTTVNQNTELNISVNAPAGASPRQTGQEVAKAVRRELNKRDRATMQAVKQRIGE